MSKEDVENWKAQGWDSQKILLELDKKFSRYILPASDVMEKFAPYLALAYEIDGHPAESEINDETLPDRVVEWLSTQADNHEYTFLRVMVFMYQMSTKAIADGLIDESGQLTEKGREKQNG